MDIDKEFSKASIAIQYIINEIDNIYRVNKSDTIRKSCIARLPDLKDIDTDPWLKETINIYDNNKLSKLSMGIGYYDSNALAERSYCQINQTKYGYTEWKFVSTKQLN